MDLASTGSNVGEEDSEYTVTDVASSGSSLGSAGYRDVTCSSSPPVME